MKEPRELAVNALIEFTLTADILNKNSVEEERSAPVARLQSSERELIVETCSTMQASMLKQIMRFAVLTFALGIAFGQTTKPAKTDEQIKQEIIAQSIASSKGNCPCPYSKDKAGRNCGGRSAYSRPGGASPLCYSKDVSQKMVDDYRKKNK